MLRRHEGRADQHHRRSTWPKSSPPSSSRTGPRCRARRAASPRGRARQELEQLVPVRDPCCLDLDRARHPCSSRSRLRIRYLSVRAARANVLPDLGSRVCRSRAADRQPVFSGSWRSRRAASTASSSTGRPSRPPRARSATSSSPPPASRSAAPRMAGEADVDRAVEAARAALDGPGAGRRRTSARASCTRSPTRSTRTARSSPSSSRATSARRSRRSRPRSAARSRTSASSRRCSARSRGRSNPIGGSLLTYSLKEPVGVAAQIVPWNYPLLMATWKLSPALAAGCSVVLKPDPQTPLSVLRRRRARDRGRLPRGRDQHRSRRRPDDRRVSRQASRRRQGRVHRLDEDGRRDHAALLRPDQAADARARRQEPEPRLRRRGPRRRDPELGVVDLLLRRPELRGALARARRGVALRRVRLALRRLREADQRRRPARRRDADGLAHLDRAPRPRARASSSAASRRAPRSSPAARSATARARSTSRPCSRRSTTRWTSRRRRSSARSSP